MEHRVTNRPASEVRYVDFIPLRAWKNKDAQTVANTRLIDRSGIVNYTQLRLEKLNVNTDLNVCRDEILLIHV